MSEEYVLLKTKFNELQDRKNHSRSQANALTALVGNMNSVTQSTANVHQVCIQFITDNTIQFLIISLILSPCHANHKSVFLNQSTESSSLKPISSFLVCYYLFFNEMLDILLICSYSVVGLECYRPISGVCCIPYQCYNATWVREDREYWDTCFRDPHCPLPP